MCFNCPHCNGDNDAAHPCQDVFGSNAKPMGGYVGLADCMGFATEFQGDSTPHGHGFVSLVNVYQHGSLADVAKVLEANGQKAAQDEEVSRLLAFFTHLKTEELHDSEKHEKELAELETQFHNNNAGPAENIKLSMRPAEMYEARGPCAWSRSARGATTISQDGSEWVERYMRHVQFVCSRVQHHWHTLKNGKRVPTTYCKPKGKTRDGCACKRGFPKYVARDARGVIVKDKHRARVVCHGVAAEMRLKCSGRRDALGMVLGPRQSEWYSGTSSILSELFLSNTDVQAPYRVPLFDATHDKDCKSGRCVRLLSHKALAIIAMKAMKQMAGYFGGYISKRQKAGRFGLRNVHPAKREES